MIYLMEIKRSLSVIPLKNQMITNMVNQRRMGLETGLVFSECCWIRFIFLKFNVSNKESRDEAASEGSTLALKPRADVTRSVKRG